MTARTAWPRVLLGGTPVDLLDAPDAVATIVAHATSTEPWPLGVMSANLDHIHHFGCHGPSSLVPFTWAHPAAGEPPRARFRPEDAAAPAVRWLNLLDGAPLVRHAAHLTGRAWPRLAGSDLIDPILDAAEVQGLRVGFLGGRPEVLTALGERLAVDRPGLVVAGPRGPGRRRPVPRLGRPGARRRRRGAGRRARQTAPGTLDPPVRAADRGARAARLRCAGALVPEPEV
jgi:hypothetical protein